MGAYEEIWIGFKRDGTPETIRGQSKYVTLIGGPRDLEIVEGGAEDYVEVTAYGETLRTAIWAPREPLTPVA